MMDELELFKRQIDLVGVAQHFGYELLHAESSRHCKVMRSSREKIVVAIDPDDNHWVYFSIGADRDRGSVIDFVQRRLGTNLGQTRKWLRGWVGSAALPIVSGPHSAGKQPGLITLRRVPIIATWEGMRAYTGNYLHDRGLSDTIVAGFGVRRDGRGNACFPHFATGGGLSGWELKNVGFTGFVAGGIKGLLLAQLVGGDVGRIVIAEAGIDCMSYAQLHGQPGDLFVSTAGSLSLGQGEQIAALLACHPKAHLVLATDADAAGDALASMLMAMASTSRPVTRDRPAAKDWNDVLRGCSPCRL